MTEREFMDWAAYYEQAPFDDTHRYHRPAALLATSLSGGDMKEHLSFLINDRSIPENDPKAIERTLLAFGITKD